MQKPKVIMHNSISIDGSILGFDVNMEQHYQIANSYKADVHLIGSNTVKEGIKMFYPEIPKEEKSDFLKPNRKEDLPLWVIPDTKGILNGMHHVYRRFEWCKDIVVLISNETPRNYIEYLIERNYDYYTVGEDYVDYHQALNLLTEHYNVKTILTDTGKILNSILLNNGLVDEISLLVHPVIVGEKQYTLFSDICKNIDTKLISLEKYSDSKIWVRYKVKNA
jgi:2,5-diamino-6-(ribosylamino)-4(3H)-pyrimidinone 5'-phosphate reductase